MTRRRIGEQIGERLPQLFPIRYLSSAVSRHERLCEHRKILHVRAENDRDSGNDCFHRILSALMGAATKQDQSLPIGGIQMENLSLSGSRKIVQTGDIIFNAASVTDAFARNA